MNALHLLVLRKVCYGTEGEALSAVSSDDVDDLIPKSSD